MSILPNGFYRDTLFKFTFGNPEHKEFTLSLYNAMNGTDYQDPSLIQITTIEDVLYLGMRNDVSFLIGDTMSLYESQSTYNPNMPLRMLQYAGGIYEAYCRDNDLDKYSSRTLALPEPRLVVFYNGSRREPDRKILRLTDSFRESERHDIEVCVEMVNINCGHNRDLMERCRPLQDYSVFVDRVGRYRKEIGLHRAIDRALEELGADSVLGRLLRVHKAEVKDMLLTEYNEQEQLRLSRKDAFKQGLEEGIEKGHAEGLEKGLEKGRVESQNILRLNSILLKERRYQDLEKATVDAAFRDELLKEYGIV